MPAPDRASPRVGLFATCLMNVFRPNVGFASVKLLQQAGCVVEVPAQQTCCGQPNYNSGDFAGARSLAKHTIAAFEQYDYVVGPSGSCMATIRHDYPSLLADEPIWHDRAKAVSDKAYELMSFLTDVLGVEKVRAQYKGVATYHDSCSGLRSLNVRAQPRALLASVGGLQLKEMTDTEVCCGFGGTFCVKYPEISERMVDDKLANVQASGADTLLGGDLGCLMNIAGRAARKGLSIKVFHAAEVLADMADDEGLTGKMDAA